MKGGRPKGSKNAETLEREAVAKAVNQRILTHADSIVNAQLALAKGQTYLYRIDETGEGKTKKREHVLVTDPEEIKQVLDEAEGNGVVDEKYYYITTKDPNNMAIDSLFNRAIGKAADKLEVSGTILNANISLEAIEQAEETVKAKLIEE